MAAQPLNWFRNAIASMVSVATLDAYTGDAEQFLAWLDSRGVSYTHASSADIKAYRDHLRGNYAPSSVRRKLATLRRFYSLAKQAGLVGHNPAADISPPMAEQKRRPRFTQSEITRLLEAPSHATGRGIRDRAIMALATKYTLKTSEIRTLDVSDVDLNADLIHVNGSVRAVDQATIKRLRAWLVVRGLMNPATTALFVSIRGNDRLSQRAIRMLIQSYHDKLRRE
jgi:integrase/recombinase XerD